MTIKNTIADRDLEALRAAIAGKVVVAGQAGYDQARQAWNLAVDERPGVVVVAGSAADVVQAVRYARARGMRIAPQGTGHSYDYYNFEDTPAAPAAAVLPPASYRRLPRDQSGLRPRPGDHLRPPRLADPTPA